MASTRKLTRRRLRSRRVKVVLAAGLVFGIGSFATLAAWTDTENATGSFGASIFDTESQSAGSPTYASNTIAPGATLTFSTPTAMSPGASRYAWLNVRTTPTTTVAGTVSFTGINSTGVLLAPALQYRVVQTAANAACTATTFTTGTPVFMVGNATTWVGVTAAIPTQTPRAIGAAGAEVGYCFDVRIAPTAANNVQGQTGTVTWTFTSTSNS